MGYNEDTADRIYVVLLCVRKAEVNQGTSRRVIKRVVLAAAVPHNM